MSVDSTTGRVTGTPNSSRAGDIATITLHTTSSLHSLSLPPSTVTVLPAAVTSPPTISGVPTTSIRDGQEYSFTPTVLDIDTLPEDLTYSIANMDSSWMSFDTSTGKLSGTASFVEGETNVYPNIVVSVVDDANNLASLEAFEITVTK